MQSIGFTGSVPLNEGSFLAGSDAPIDDAPIGYYRFHYWINGDTCKSHDNYIYLSKHCGIVLVSLQAEKNNYRVLIRSVLGWKACVIDSNSVLYNSKMSLRSRVIFEALKRYCAAVLPSEEADLNVPTSPILSMASIGVSGDINGDASISRNSSLSSFRSNFAYSKFNGSFMASQDSICVSKLGSFSSLADLSSPLSEDSASELDPERIKNIREDLLFKFIKSGSHVKDASFPAKLLDLEKSLTPKSFNIDLVNMSSDDSEAFKKLTEALGEEINRKETINYIKILTEKYEIAESLTSLARSKSEVITSANSDSKRLSYIIAEFIETERNYLHQLRLLDQVFIDYLKNDASGKFILKIREFKDIFDGIFDFIPIHNDFLAALSKAEGIQNFAEALRQLVDSKKLYEYQGYFTTFEKRMASLHTSLNTNPKFAKFHEDCVRKNAALNKKGLDQFFIAPIQRMPRYSLLLKEIIKYVQDETLLKDLKDSFVEIEKTVQFLNTVKHKAEQTEMLFMMQRKINNFPPDFLRADRTFIAKIACYLTSNDSDDSSRKARYTMYLCNDMVLFAKKRSNATGLITHDFIFAVGIRDIQLLMTRGRKGESKNGKIDFIYLLVLEHYFNADIDMEQACFTLNRSDIDSSLIGLKKSNSCLLNEAFISNSSLRFLPKNQRKISSFFNDFTEARNQFILSESPAKLLFQRDDGRDIFYHAFNRAQFESWNSKSPVAVIFLEEDNEIDFESYMGLLGDYQAVAIIQGRQQKYRFCIRSRKTQFNQSGEECQLHLHNLNAFIGTFKKAGKCE